MVFVKHNSLKSDIFFNPMFIPGFSGFRFSGFRFFRVQVFQGPGLGCGSSVRVQVLEVAHLRYLIIIDHVLTIYIKLCYVYVNFKRISQNCSYSKISESVDVEGPICGRNGKQFFQYKQEKL